MRGRPKDLPATKCGHKSNRLNNFAISSTGIGEALQRSASALYESGNTIDESIALITAANSVVQNPETVGTAMKTLSLRLRGAKADLEDAGEEVDGMCDSVSELQAKLLALTGGKVDIMLDKDTFKNTTEILREMSQVWDDMTDVNRAAALELMGGKRQANVLSSIIKNFDTVEDVIQTSLDSEGSAYKENEKYLDSIQGRIDLFKNATQTMWTNVLNSEVIKFFVNAGTEIVKLIDKVGLLKSALATLFAAGSIKGKGLEFFKTTENGEIGFGDLFTKTGKTNPLVDPNDVLNVDQFKEKISEYMSAFDPLKSSWADYVSQLEDADPAMKQILSGFKDQTEAATMGAGAYDEYAAAANQTGIQIQGVGIKSAAAAIGVKALNAALSWGIGLLIGLAIEGITNGIDYLIHRTEKLKEEVADLTKEYKTSKEEFTKNLKDLTEPSDTTLYTDLTDEFKQLAQGVDNLGNNVGLAADEYNRYKTICEKIVGIQPSIAGGYDSATEAIGNNVSILEKLIELQKIQARNAAIEYVSDSNLKKQTEAAVSSYKDAQKKYSELLETPIFDESRVSDLTARLYKAMSRDTTNYSTADKLWNVQYQDLDAILGISGLKLTNGTSSVEYLKKMKTEDLGKIVDTLRSLYESGEGFEWTDPTDIVYSMGADQVGVFLEEFSSLYNESINKIDAAENELEQKKKALVDTLLQIPASMSEYEGLSSGGKNFVAQWIRNSKMFDIDENTDATDVLGMKTSIQTFIRNLANGVYKYTVKEADNIKGLNAGQQIDASMILDQIVDIDPSTVDYATYQKQVQKLIDVLWESLGTAGQALFDNNKNNLAESIGFDFTTKNNDITKQANAIAERIKMDSKVIQYKLQQMTPAEVDAFLKIDWNTTDINSWDDVVSEIQGQAQSFNAFSVDMFSTISDDISKFNEILSQTEEIVADNTTVTKEYKESLTALGFSQEDLNDVFDESNPLLVKNAALLRKLVTQKKEEKRATVQMAKANNLLQYRNTVKQLQQVVKAMATERNSATGVTKATLKTVDALRSQLTTLKQTQREYALLEIQLSGATNAYENFEKAKSMDEKLTYGDSMIEMLNTLNDGFKTGQVGIEAFQAAVATLVPSSVYEDLDNFNDRMVAIHDYIDQNPLFADWFTIKDGEFSITQKNIQNFVDDAQKAGAFTGSDENGNFDLGEGVETIDDFANKINEAQDGVGVTKEAVVAMITEFSKYDATWSDVLYDLTTNKFDKEVNKTTTELEKAVSAQDEYIRSGKSLDGEEWKTICKNVEAAEAALNKANAAAQQNTDQYTKLQTLYNMAQGKIKGTKDEADALAKSLGLVDKNGKGITFELDENGKLKLTTEQAEILNQKLGKLKEPTIVSVQFDFDTLSKQLEVAKKYIKGDELSEEDKTVLFNAGINVDKITPEQLQAKINSLPEDQKQVLLDAAINFDGLSKEEIQQKIDEMPDDQKKVLLDAGIKVDALTADELTTACNNLISTVEPTLKSISLTYGITQTSEEQQDGTIEKLKNWEVSGIHFTAYAEVDGDGKKKVEELNEEKDKLSEPETTTYTVDGTGEQAVYGIKDAWAAIPTTKTTTYTVKQEGSIPGGGDSLNGTAHASGSWGADKSDTSLVGELGPELRVRGNHWDMLGENGAEFTDVKKGDIIFNHKQTKSLLENGYINSRGKAYAGGTSNIISDIFDNLKLKKLAKDAEKMCKQYEELVNGNVDLRKRPHLSPSYEHDLAIGGGYNSFIGSDGEIYASTSAETVTIGDKNKYTIDITPVLENGDVLTSDALADYIDGLVTNGSTQDLLDSDKYNLVIRAVPGEYDEKDWTGFEGELSKYKDGYLNTIMEMFSLGGDKAVESSGFSSVGLAGVVKDLQGNDSYTGKEVASAIDDTSDGMRELDNLINQYVTDVLNAKSLADDIGTDLSQTKYGNVDTNDRQELYWDEESLDKYGDAIDSWGMKADDLVGTYSTLLSSVGEFDGEDISFTPILQTENGPQLLDSNTVDKYIWGLIDEAKQNDGKWTSDELFQLDTKGLEVDGVIVKNLLEGIGQDANKTAKLLHYVGDTGAISNLEGEIESTSSELVATGENVSAVQAKLDKLNATSISDKTFTVTTDYRTIGSGTERTIHTPGASGRLTIYADGTAHASGDWGVKQDETGSLVGELGPETLVRNGKWKTIGDNGAEMVNLKKGDIIFNHKQTEQLLKNGHINSRGKMVGGRSFAEGNAHYGLFTGYTDYEEVFKNGSNDWVEAWDDTLRSISDAADSISGAGDDLSDAADDFEEMFDWFAVLLEEIDDDLNYVSAKLENAVGISAKNSLQDEMININKLKLTELGEGYKLYADYAAQLLEKVPEQYRNLAEQGGVALTEFLGEANQEVVEAINNYREWAQKASDVRTQQQQVKKEITSLSLEKVQTIADEYDRVIAKITTLNDLLQANVDLIDEQGERTSAVMYEEMIKNSIKELDELQKKRNDMQKEFDAQVSAGNIDVGSEEWYEGVAAIQDVDKAIIDCRKEIEGFQNSINQLHWDNFDGLIKAIDNVGNEISNLGDLIDDEDIADEMGNWTNEGITKMGLLAQEMERAQYRAKQYAEQIEYLNQEYAAGKYSTDEYNEKLQELKDGQWDSIKSYEAAKDALIALNKTRVDAAKNAMQEEIDAYNELINKKKEELQLSKDAHDFSKQVEEQQKNIANIQKQLAAIAGDNSASAIARRKKLEAELAAAQEELDELYYSHSIEKQQDALDDQAENYQDEKEKEMEALDEYLKNVEQVIADSFATITGNTEVVAETLKEIADEYGINLSEAITNPWEQGVIAIGTYQDQLNTSTSAFTAQLEAIKKQLLDLQAAADETARHLIDATNQNANKTSSATYTTPTPSTPQQPSAPQKPAAPANGSSVTVKKSATHFTRDGGNGTRMQSWVPGSTFTVYQVSGSEVLIGRNGQYTGWIKLSDIEGYAKGIKKVPNDQFAITDELGLEELVLHADTNGRLQYLSKGSSVIPSDITDNLMKLGTLDPKDILDRNKPKIGAPYIINNSIELNMSFGNMINIEHADRDSIPDIKDAVKAQLDSYMKGVNNSLKRFTR